MTNDIMELQKMLKIRVDQQSHILLKYFNFLATENFTQTWAGITGFIHGPSANDWGMPYF